MKIPDNAMILTNSEYRPCIVAVGNHRRRLRALFHRWVTKQGTLPMTGSPYTTTQALVEFENGSIETINPEDVRFKDSKQLFEQFAWGDEKETT